MAVNHALDQGIPLQGGDISFRVSPNANVYIGASNTVAGVVPFRAVIADAAATYTHYGENMEPAIMHPPYSFAHANVLGIMYESQNTLNTFPTDDGLVYKASTRQATVRTHGIALVQCDNSVAGAAITPGDLVAVSQVQYYEGCACKAALSSGLPSAGQHILGIAMQLADTNGQYVKVLLRVREV